MAFYSGNVLRLDLTALRASVEPLNAEWARLFVGGKGLLLRYLFEELAPGTDALAPENPLILATGPFAGTLAATCSRLAVGCKSPATGTLLDSYVGGSFAPELKFAGYDLVVITGRAPEPVLVRITDDKVEFVPAEGRYWGLETAQLEELIRTEMGPGAKVLSTGPAGENLVPFACLSTDQFHKAGRGGAGAVMGSKNLKGVAVRGTGAVTVGDAGAFTRDILRLQNERVLTDDNAWTYEEGTPFLVEAVNGASALPTRNWRTGTFDGAGTIGSAALLKIRTKVRACAQCPLACRQVHDFGDYICEGPEFETLGLCGSNCGISDLAAIAAFNRECDDLGLDTMSTGAVVALAMDLCEQGVADYGLRFGDTDAYLEAPRLIAMRQGFGAELALGARDLAELRGRPDLAIEVKGLEMPAYDPRGTFGMGLGYATSDRGACHMRAFTAGDDILGGAGAADSLAGKAQLVADQQDFSAVAWTGVWCANMALDTDFLGVHFRHLWGRETSHEELMTIGARIWNLGRLLNLREGLCRDDDRLPERILSVPHPDGVAAGKAVGDEAFRESLDEYYRLRGWDAEGVPSPETLSRLSLAELGHAI
ncbi:MAG: aldehyde ferredoxin oxidoreductase family protein [Actinobacteria bacterium]|nr:aldehyde ferredoxin oxidoreductase family protein [Actinomycetota bacterium]